MKYFIFCILLLTGFGCSAITPRDISGSKLKIFQIDTGIANVYVIQAEKKVIMVDTSAPPKQEMVVNELAKLGIKPEEISLIVVTHGHGDHAGNAKYFQEKYKVKIAGGEGDLEKFKIGKNQIEKAEAIGIMARLLKPFVVYDFVPFQPDVPVNAEIDLAEFGINGKIIPIPAHTPGSIAVIIENKIVFSGDLLRGGIVFNKSPTEHFYHENRNQSRQQVDKLLKLGIETFYPAHFGPLQSKDVKEDFPFEEIK